MNAKALVISRVGSSWLLSDSDGALCRSDNRNVLSDLLGFVRVRKEVPLEVVKSRFSQSCTFLR